jgi:nickel transport system permease protein
MLKFIARRLLALIPILLLMSIVVFLMLRMAKGDPAMAYLQLSNIPPTDEAMAEARHSLGLDRPIVVQYVDWLGRALRLDFGISYTSKQPVLEGILRSMPVTLDLAFKALAVTLLVSFPLGILAALRKDRLFDHATRVFAFIGVSLPGFWFGLMLVTLFSVVLKVLPPMGRGTPAHYIMPLATLSLMSIAINIRFIRASLLEQMKSRSVLYARSRGLTKGAMLLHVLRNALLPVVTAIGMHLGELLGGAVIVENIFAWPGVGRYALFAISNRDYPVLQCFILFMTVVFVLCTLASDILCAWLDPRLRLGSGEQQ